MRKLLLLLLLALTTPAAFAGKAITLSTQMAGNSSIPALPTSQSCTIEFQAAGWDDPTLSQAVEACPVSIQWLNLGGGDIRLQMFWTRGAGGSVCQTSSLATLVPDNIMYVRFGVDIPNLLTNCEVWDSAGTKVHSTQQSYTSYSGSNSNGVTVAGGGSGQDISYGFFRVLDTLVPYGFSMPKTSANSNMLVHWKWDLGNNTNSLDDASGNGYTATMSAGSPAYVAQEGQSLVLAVPKTGDAKVWGTWITQRVGHPGSLSGTESLTQADTDDLSYQWTQTAGDTVLAIADDTAATTTFTNHAFGGYTMSLTVTDANMNTDTASLPFGAATCTDDGVLVPDDPNVTTILGPAQCFGHNPWGYADERALYAVGAQTQYFTDMGFDDPVWTHYGAGATSYKFAGYGFGGGGAAAGTTTVGDITAADTSIDIAEAANIPGLASLPGTPTWIFIGVDGSLRRELVRVCDTTGTSGPQTLTVCYNGRGLSAVLYDGAPYTLNSSWLSGTVVASSRLTGTSTEFLTDADRPLCPAGPGPMGPVVYSTGTVTLTGDDPTIMGSGTSWTTENGVIATRMIRIEATHGGGTPFVYWSRIAAVGGTTSITADRDLPSDVDSGPFPYQIISSRYPSMGFDTADGQMVGWQAGQGCETETAAFLMPVRDIAAINNTTMTSQPVTYIDSFGIQSALGPNFYGSGFALRSFYFRSGYAPALVAANWMDDNWVTSPELAGGYYGGLPLSQGGGVIGALAAVSTSTGTSLTWDKVQAFIRTSASHVSDGCNDLDTRDSSYYQGWLTLAALYDPDMTRHAAWIAALEDQLTRDETCGAATSYTYANSFIFNAAGPAITLTEGMDSGSGTDLDPSICTGNGQQTVTVVAGGTTVTATMGTFPVGTDAIWINGKYIGVSRTDSTHLEMGQEWGGASDSYTSMTVNSTDAVNNNTVFGIDASSPSLAQNYGCVWNSDSSITLDRNWDFDSDTYHIYSYTVSGYGQQPYMLGIKLTAMEWATHVDDAGIVSGYQAIIPQSAEWWKTVGFDSDSKASFYGRIYGACESYPTSTLNSDVAGWAIPHCRYTGEQSSVRAGRTLIAEASSALRAYYATGAGDRVTFGDEAYGAIWGYCPWTDDGYYCDANYVRDELSDTSLALFKWPGFFFGMGLSHQWPAVRLGMSSDSGGVTLQAPTRFGGPTTFK